MYGVEINRQGEWSIYSMNSRVFSLIMAGVLTAGLLVGCSSNSEDTKIDYTVKPEQAIDEQKMRKSQIHWKMWMRKILV